MNASQALHFDRELLSLARLLNPWTRQRLLALCLGASCLACEPNKEAPSQPQTTPAADHIAKDATPDAAPAEPVTPETIILQGQGISLNVGDFERWVTRSILFAPDQVLASGNAKISAQTLAMPHLQTLMSRAMLHAALVEILAAERRIEVAAEEINERLSSDPMLNRFKPDGIHLKQGQVIPTPLIELGLSLELLREYARQEVLNKKLTEHLLNEVSDDTLWQLWSQRQETVSALIVQIPNVPSAQAIDALIAKEPEALTAHLEAHRDRFESPRMVVLDLLLAPAELSDQDALKRAQALLESGTPAEQVAAQTGLKLSAQQSMMRQEDTPAFRAKVGQVGISKNAPRGTYVWKVTGFKEPAMPELNHAFKREIAADLLSSRGPVQAAQRTFERARQQLRMLQFKPDQTPDPASVQETLRALEIFELKAQVTEHFPRDEQGFIPKVGLAKPLSDALFQLSPLAPMIEQPILSRGVVFAGILLEHKRAKREDFDKQRDTLRPQLLEQLRPRILEDTLARLEAQRQVKMDLSPLKRRYGQYEKRPRAPQSASGNTTPPK